VFDRSAIGRLALDSAQYSEASSLTLLAAEAQRWNGQCTRARFFPYGFLQWRGRTAPVPGALVFNVRLVSRLQHKITIDENDTVTLQITPRTTIISARPEQPVPDCMSTDKITKPIISPGLTKDHTCETGSSFNGAILQGTRVCEWIRACAIDTCAVTLGFETPLPILFMIRFLISLQNLHDSARLLLFK